ncbi:hypothetical protein [Bradyrhizobium guangdongense]|uniref:hypothetical protein n=1 Tax=Bradyrhizobium guangdongense TaxID=1325090 RepID=UPI001642CBBB|nr:hypothetical protein [Bradyrhizobium guangdongense]
MTAFTGMSAARAEPETIASAVANKANFFIAIPITEFKGQPDPGAPRGMRPDCEFLTNPIWSAEVTQ